MIIGIDFDNTIVCYDKLFHKIALEKKLIPKNLPQIKDEIRNYLRKCEKEDAWTELQGYAYGPGIVSAEPFEGVLDFFVFCKQNKIELNIISYKTLQPFLGSKYNLHEYAHRWLEKLGFYDHNIVGLSKKNVFFELTKEDKLKRIGHQGCSHYIDDLPEFLMEKNFPSGINRILFDTNAKYKDNANFLSISTWHEMTEMIKSIQNSSFLESKEFKKFASGIIQKYNLGPKYSLKQFKGGRNNRVFSMIFDGGRKFLLKMYFQHQNDPINRVKAEYLFSKYTWNSSIRSIPKPYATDFRNNIAIYEFIEGRKLHSSEINNEKIEKALNFFKEINRSKNSDEAKKLQIGKEACFSINDHINLVKTRVERLREIDKNIEIDVKASIFVENDLSEAWQNALNHVNDFIYNYNLDPKKEIPDEDKCISPSDFGFHNAILDNSGNLFFIDFEYSGWDDPAKMVCDFFCQVDIPVPFKYYNSFVKTTANDTSDPTKFEHRIKALFPVYQIKWCCILLNDFLRVESERRNFAYSGIDNRTQKANQLEKAVEYLHEMELKRL